MDRFKVFFMDGLLTVRELEELGKTFDLGGKAFVSTSLPSESTDPSWYGSEVIEDAKRMAQVYFRLYLFENKVRRFIEKVMAETHGEKWFEQKAPPQIKKEALRRQEEEGMARFHQPRGDGLLHYVSLPDLGKIISENWDDFEPMLYRKEWVMAKFEDLRLTRNAVAHMGAVSPDDLARLDVILRDWNRQTG